MLTKDEIQHIAHLARISLTEQEKERYQKDLSSILDYFKQLGEVNTDDVEPIGHITGMRDIVREDREVPFGENGKKQIMDNAPQSKDGFYKVKSIL